MQEQLVLRAATDHDADRLAEFVNTCTLTYQGVARSSPADARTGLHEHGADPATDSRVALIGDEIFGLARSVSLEDGPAIKNAAVRERLADLYVKTQGVRLTRFRTMTALSRGETPGPENSIGKLVNAPKAQEIASFAMDLLDMGGVVMDKDLAPLRAAFQESLLSSPGGRIAAGTDEILRNIIAERVLGLPQDVRVDRDLPFDQLPTSAR